MSVDHEQQLTLERVADRMADRAIIAYAAPVFHRSADLFRHGVRGTVVENTTFPDIADMSGHARWYYNEPGARGIRNPDSEPVTFRSLSERIDALSRDVGEVSTASRELTSLAASIRSSTLAEDIEPNAREAYLAQQWRAVDSFCDATNAPEVVRGYLAVEAFCRFFGVGWLIIAEGDQSGE